MAKTRIGIYVSSMHDQLFMPPSTADSGRLLVKRAWEVFAPSTYQVRWPDGYPLDGFVLVRVLSGHGRIILEGGRVLDCRPGTAACLRPSSIRGYGCLEELWRFWWIECAEGSTCALELDAVAEIPSLPGEADALMEGVRLLEAGGASSSVAAASLTLLVRKWELHLGEKASGQPRDGAIIEVLALMRRTMSKPLGIGELARRAHLSESRFRQVFAQAVGMSPKAYYGHLRLAKAVEWLRGSDMKLAEMAGRLGYASAFHLSKAFKLRYGAPPSAFRPVR